MEEKRPMLGTKDRTEEFLQKLREKESSKHKPRTKRISTPKVLSKKKRHIAKIEKRQRVTNKETETFLKHVNIIKKNIENLKMKVDDVRKKQGIVFSAPITVEKDFEELEKLGDVIYSECYVIQDQVKNLELDAVSQFGSQRKMRCIQKEYLLSQLTQVMNDFRLMQTGYVEKRKRQYRENWITSTTQHNHVDNVQSREATETINPKLSKGGKLLKKLTFIRPKRTPSQSSEKCPDLSQDEEKLPHQDNNTETDQDTYSKKNSELLIDVEKENSVEHGTTNIHTDKNISKGTFSRISARLSFRGQKSKNDSNGTESKLSPEKEKVEKRRKSKVKIEEAEEEEEEDIDAIFRRYSTIDNSTNSTTSGQSLKRSNSMEGKSKVANIYPARPKSQSDFECHSIKEEENGKMSPVSTTGGVVMDTSTKISQGEVLNGEKSAEIDNSILDNICKENLKGTKLNLLKRFSFTKKTQTKIDTKESQHLSGDVIVDGASKTQEVTENIESTEQNKVHNISTLYSEHTVEPVAESVVIRALNENVSKGDNPKIAPKVSFQQQQLQINSKENETLTFVSGQTKPMVELEPITSLEPTVTFMNSRSEIRGGKLKFLSNFTLMRRKSQRKSTESELQENFQDADMNMSEIVTEEKQVEVFALEGGNSQKINVVEAKKSDQIVTMNTEENISKGQKFKPRFPFKRQKSRSPSEGEESQKSLLIDQYENKMASMSKSSFEGNITTNRNSQSFDECSTNPFDSTSDTSSISKGSKAKLLSKLQIKRRSQSLGNERAEVEKSDDIPMLQQNKGEDNSQLETEKAENVTEPLLQSDLDIEMDIETEKSRQELEAIKKREERLKKLEQNIVDMSELHKEFYSIVQSQGETMNKIEYYVDTAQYNVEEGTEQLLQAEKLNKKMCKRKVLCGIVTIAVILITVVVILVFTV